MANPEEYFYLMETTPLVQSSKIGQILTKTVYQILMSHIHLYYALQMFLIIFGKHLQNTSFLLKKVTISERI